MNWGKHPFYPAEITCFRILSLHTPTMSTLLPRQWRSIRQAGSTLLPEVYFYFLYGYSMPCRCFRKDPYLGYHTSRAYSEVRISPIVWQHQGYPFSSETFFLQARRFGMVCRQPAHRCGWGGQGGLRRRHHVGHRLDCRRDPRAHQGHQLG
jgi:hypothetical protein